MWPVLKRKISADFKARRTQTLLLMLTFTLAIAIVTMAAIAMRSLDAPYERAHAIANGSHLRIGVANEQRSALLETLQEQDGVEIGEAPLLFEGAFDSDGWQDVVFAARPTTDTNINQLIVTEGRFLDGAMPMGALVSQAFAARFATQVGDTLSVQVVDSAEPTTLTILGIASEIAYASPTRIYVLSSTLAQWQAAYSDLEPIPSSIPIRFASGENWQAQRDLLLEAISADIQDTPGFFVTDWQQIGETYTDSATIFLVFVFSFGVFIVLAACVILANAVIGTIMQAYRDIGILKSMGMTPNQITLLYLGQNLFIGAMALLIGLPLGVLLSMFAIRPIASQLGALATPIIEPAILLTIAVAVLCAITIFVLWPARRAGKTQPTAALRARQQSAGQRQPIVARLMQAVRAPYLLILGAQEAFAQPRRISLTILSIVLGVVSMTFALGIQVSMQHMIDHPAAAGFLHDITVTVPCQSDQPCDATASQAAIDTLQNNRTVESFYIRHGGSYFLPVEHDDFTITFELWALDDPQALFATYTDDNAWPQTNNQLLMTQDGLSDLGLTIGESIFVPGYEQEFTIVGSYAVAFGSGYGLIVDVNHSPLPVALASDRHNIGVIAAPPQTADLLTTQLTQQLGDGATVTPIRIIPPEMGNLPYALIGFALVVILIGAIGILNALYMNIRERTRVYATFKTIGFTPRQIMRVLVSAAGILALFGVVIGFPLGILFTGQLVPFIADYFGYPGEIIIPIRWGHLTIVAFATVALCLLGGYLPARHAANVTVTEALRYE